MERAGRLEAERLDVTLPGRTPPTGRIHPLTEVLDEIVDIFVGLGFQVAEGPLVETDYYSFQALNIPQDHAARSMQDTFYVDTGTEQPFVLRPHTSPMQVRLMETTKPPLYVVVPGVVARRDEVDANHLAQFMQIEGLAVDEGITFSDLKGVLDVFAKHMFGANLTVRMHPSYFPFTEPSAEVYVSCFACDGSGCPTCRGEGWIEIMGAGMVHPNVFRSVGYPPDTTGFAFGMGIERIAKLKYSVGDLRSFYENDLRFLDSR
jgi:phenylalanyl-tRNA synthetase alpha chain